MKKIHTNTLIPMVEEDCLANLFYIVIGTHKEICCAFVWLCEKARSYIIRLIQYITKNI